MEFFSRFSPFFFKNHHDQQHYTNAPMTNDVFTYAQAFSEISGIITMFYVVRALSPYTEYEFYVIAVNNIGRGPPSVPATTTTGETGKNFSHTNPYLTKSPPPPHRKTIRIERRRKKNIIMKIT